MAVTLYVERERWLDHLGATLAASPGLIPVVKGNGYGFGRERLARLALDLGADEIAVGTVHEVASVPAGPTITVLTPALGPELGSSLPAAAVPTVGSLAHVDALAAAGFGGRVVVKLASPMRRFGVMPSDLPDLLARLDRRGCTVHAFGLHFPLASASPDHARGVEKWLPLLPAGATLHVSHVDHQDLASVGDRPPRRSPSGPASAPRCGTATSRRCGSGPTCSTGGPSPPAIGWATACRSSRGTAAW